MRNTLLNLPLHPTMRHPLTGQPLRAVGLRKDGRAIWPIMGGAPDDPPADPPKQGDPPADPPKQEDPPKGDPPKQGDLGFPANTPVVEMTHEQQVAYYKHQGRKHEERATAYWNATGGKSADEVKQILDEHATLRQQQMTTHEREVESAKLEGRKEAGLAAARTLLEVLLGHDAEKNDKTSLIETLDLTRVLTDSGDVDTVKVREIAGQFAPADKDKGTRESHDYGGGRRGDSKGSTGTAAGAERYAQRHGKKAASST